MGRRVRLHELGAVAEAVQVHLVDAEVVADRLEILDRLRGRVEGQVRLGDSRLGHAVLRERLRRGRRGLAFGRDLRSCGREVVRGRGLGALDRAGPTDPALVHVDHVVRVGDRGRVVVEVCVRIGDVAVAGPARDLDVRPLLLAGRPVDGEGDVPRLAARRREVVLRDRERHALERRQARLLRHDRVARGRGGWRRRAGGGRTGWRCRGRPGGRDAAADGATDGAPEAAGAASGDAGANVQPPDAAEPQAATTVATSRTAAGSARRERSSAGTGSG